MSPISSHDEEEDAFKDQVDALSTSVQSRIRVVNDPENGKRIRFSRIALVSESMTQLGKPPSTVQIQAPPISAARS
jgi:hypothetical protein